LAREGRASPDNFPKPQLCTVPDQSSKQRSITQRNTTQHNNSPSNPHQIISNHDSAVNANHQSLKAPLSLLCYRNNHNTSYASKNQASLLLLLLPQTLIPMSVIRKDMKTAMQNKDSNRLSVLRALLSQTLNASKTSNPINTDMQILALLRKSASAAKAASAEFKGAGRQDLADKEDLQAKIMEEYAGDVQLMGREEIRSAVKGVLDGMRSEGAKMQTGDIMKRIFSPELLGGKPVEKGDVVKIVKEMLAESP
jgi:uncharacterized protein YqeY